jgi:hypothetical protein
MVRDDLDEGPPGEEGPTPRPPPHCGGEGEQVRWFSPLSIAMGRGPGGGVSSGQALYEPDVVRVWRSKGHSVWNTPSLSTRW